MESGNSRAHLYQSVFILNMVYLLGGTCFAWSSPVLLKLGLSDSEGSRVASMLSLGSILGPFLSGALLDVIGRKVTTGVSMALFTGSCLVLTVAPDSVTLLSIGRFMAGITVGVTYSSLPIYIAELSEDSLRGFLNTLSQLFTCLGSLLILVVGPLASYALLHYLILGICCFFFLLFPLLPNSPCSLMLRNNVDQARDTLAWLRGNKSVSAIEKELQIIQNTIREDQQNKGSIKDLLTIPGNRRALLICIGLLTLQQLSGVSIIFFYAEKIFQMSGSSISTATCSIVLGIIMVISSFICPLAVKYYGYKTPLLVSASGMAIGMGGLGAYFLLKSNHFEVENINWMPLLSVVIYITFFNSGFANIPWALSGELFPSNIRSQATTVITATTGVINYLIANFFPDLVLLMGIDFLFMSFSFVCFVAIVFITLVIQDTSRLSFEEIQKMLNGHKRKEIQLRLAPSCPEGCKL